MGQILIRCQGQQKNIKTIILRISFKKIPNTKFFFCKTSPMIKLYRSFQDSQSIKVYQSKYIESQLNPIFERFQISSLKLCENDQFRKITCYLYDYIKKGQNQLIGYSQFTLNQLLNNKKQFQFYQSKTNQLIKTKLIINQFFVKQKYSFKDYILGGTQLSVAIYIDFTGSNGIATYPTSLHYMDPYKMNKYQQAIASIGQILLNYDYDKKIPLFGFGAKPKFFKKINNLITNHCFPLNDNPQYPFVHGMYQIMKTYCQAVPQLQFAGPTLFSYIFQHAMTQAQYFKMQGSKQFLISLILTDGEIHDLKQIFDLIVAASHIPLSIVIVGIGRGPFQKMIILDDDKMKIRDKYGNHVQRDLIQFVQFQKIGNDPEKLAQQVLEQIPRQLEQYMQFVNIKPNPQIKLELNQFNINATKYYQLLNDQRNQNNNYYQNK